MTTAMDSLDDSENNAKISDSAYSCSNSQSRRSLSSKSTHSGSHSSGSSGYGGKPSTSNSGCNNLGQPPEKRIKDKNSKKKKFKTIITEAIIEVEPKPSELKVIEPQKQQEKITNEGLRYSACQTNVSIRLDVPNLPPPEKKADIQKVECMEIAVPEEIIVKNEVETSTALVGNGQIVSCSTTRPPFSHVTDSFSCVISMLDGVVMYTTFTTKSMLGFPKDMWIGRSFIDFIHPNDRNTFASQIMTGVSDAKTISTEPATLCCRIRTYRGLTSGFGVKNSTVTFLPFVLNLSFKEISHEDGKTFYLVVQASPLTSAFKTPNETISKAIPFTTRHVASGKIEYIDPESVPYLGYLPQDIINKDIMYLYHPEDMGYLQQVYEELIRKRITTNSKAYRIVAQNGDFVKVETEFSCFVNPWSKKLEFVCGKHNVVEGPTNPDVFLPPEYDVNCKYTEELKAKAHAIRENLIKMMNEMSTKSVEYAKQQMSKRCLELAKYMESLREDQPKAIEELKLDITEPENCFYERDSVMLGGISPHRENDSKSSTETPLSYNQLNYSETLQRYFDSYQPCLDAEAKTNGDAMKNSHTKSKFQPVDKTDHLMAGAIHIDESHMRRLSENLLIKHNADMENELIKKHRENRPSSKLVREKTMKENRQKKKDHLARCNAPYQPTSNETATALTEHQTGHGIKRPFWQSETDASHQKYHCSWNQRARQREKEAKHNETSARNVAANNRSSANTTGANYTGANNSGANNTGANNSGANNSGAINSGANTTVINTMARELPQYMPVMSPMAAFPGMFPMYYLPTSAPTTHMNNTFTTSNASNPQHIPTSTVPYVMYPQAVFGAPLMYSPITAQNHTLGMQSWLDPSSGQCGAQQRHNPLGLTSSNYEEACKPVLTMKPSKKSWLDKKHMNSQYTSSSKAEQGSGMSSSMYSSTLDCTRNKSPDRNQLNHHHSEDNDRISMDRTDGESSYSSFCSSFFKTECGSTEDSDNRNRIIKTKSWRTNEPARLADTRKQQMRSDAAEGGFNSRSRVTKRKEPPWMQHVCMTSDLMYKYQIKPRNMKEVLEADRLKISKIEQPNLVNEQLSQLYLDMKLEGVPSRLFLEEGIVSSGSSGEETFCPKLKPRMQTKVLRRKREYSRLVMIYEEDAPLPPPTDEGSSRKHHAYNMQ